MKKPRRPTKRYQFTARSESIDLQATVNKAQLNRLLKLMAKTRIGEKITIKIITL
jgi:hypothetical protein